ncbi:SPOR domain-containing protein [Catenovulum sediminis]|uniref:SPOR domain-containing protein n=1 Tax=Catenovulum sediminis TaxID=1740262 RepID=UPI00117F22AC|nr:SPOR domain-containing protein [Catenovulum sediminis]
MDVTKKLTLSLLACLYSASAFSSEEFATTLYYQQAKTENASDGFGIEGAYIHQNYGGIYLNYTEYAEIEFTDNNNVVQNNSLPMLKLGYIHKLKLNQKLSLAFKLGAAFANQEITNSQATLLENGDTALNLGANLIWSFSDVLALDVGIEQIQDMPYFGSFSAIQLGLSYRFQLSGKSDKVIRGEISKPVPLTTQPVEKKPHTKQPVNETTENVALAEVKIGEDTQKPTLLQREMAKRSTEQTQPTAQSTAQPTAQKPNTESQPDLYTTQTSSAYKIQLGAFANPSNAKQLAQKVEQAGFKFTIENKNGLQLVYATGFANQQLAEQANDTLSEKYGTKGIVRLNKNE